MNPTRLCLFSTLLLAGCDACTPRKASPPQARCVIPPKAAVEAADDALRHLAAGDADALWARLSREIKLSLNPGDFAETVAALQGTIARGGAPVMEKAYAVEISGGRVDEPVECDGARLRLGVANQRLVYVTYQTGGAPVGYGATVTLHEEGDGWRLGGVESYETTLRDRGPSWYLAQADRHNQAEDVFAELAATLVAHALASRGVGVQTGARRDSEARLLEVRADRPPKLWIDKTSYDLRAMKLEVGPEFIRPDLHYDSHGSPADVDFLRKETRKLIGYLRERHPRLQQDFAKIRFTAFAHPSDPPAHYTRALRAP